MQILPVKQNYCTKEFLCSPQGSNPVKIKHASISRAVFIARHVLRFAVVLTLLSAAFMAVAQNPPSTPAPASDTIDQIRVIGNRRIPKETILARMFTHPGDTYDPISIERDFHSLWNTGYFEDLRIEREDSEKGIILNVFVREKPSIREINYKGLNSVSVSDVLDRFKKEKVPLSVESQYDPTKIKQAETVIKQLLAEHGHQFATIKTDVKTIPPASVQVNFNIKEGPVVKVGKIQFVGNQHIGALDLRRSMKNLKPIGIPYSIIFEDLFAQTYDSSKLEEDTERVRQAYRDKGYANAAVEAAQDADSRRGRPELVHLPAAQGQAHRHPDDHRRRRPLPARRHHLHRQQADHQPQGPARHLPIKDGDWFNATAIGKGLENLKKAYGSLGYINFGAVPKLSYRRAEEDRVHEHRYR